MTDRSDVLFVVLDSMRLDRVSAYGYGRETTPALDRLAAGATRYSRAYTAAPWTLPSHCSMFTGLFPSEHGVTNGFGDATPRLPDSITTLTERLSEDGYRTAGFSNNPWVGQLSGLDRGFDEFVEWDLSIGRSDDTGIHTTTDRALSAAHSLLGRAARQPVFLLKRRFFTRRLVSRAIRWFDAGADAEQPTFTFMNLMEAHSPYFPPAAAFEALGLPAPSTIEPRLLNTKLLASVLGKRTLTDEERERVMAYYDASLRFQDDQLRRLLESLELSGRADDTLIVICADHGKTLGDYDRDAVPPHYAREINVRVPLVIKHPGQRTGEVLDHPFELPTIHDLIIETDRAATDRRPVEGQRSTRSETTQDVALVQDHLPHAGRSKPESVTRWSIAAARDYKLVQSDEGDEYLFSLSGGRDRLLSDPDEDVLDDLRYALESRSSRLANGANEDVETAAIDADVQSQLHDLGYM